MKKCRKNRETEMNSPSEYANSGSFPDRRFIFTITTGRSGTNFLAELFASNLGDAQVYHEQRAHSDWGINCPDVSHLTTFNQLGSSSHLRAFWSQKLGRIRALDVRYFAETSHTLAKAGLVENLDLLRGAGVVHLIHLKRDIADTVISFTHRADFSTRGNMWLWYLDPGYPNALMNPEPFIGLGQIGFALWYVMEMRVRAEYYRLLLAGQADVVLHEVDMEQVTGAEGAAKLLADVGTTLMPAAVRMPGQVNANVGAGLETSVQQYIRDVVGSCTFDAAEVARARFDQGYRLAPAAETHSAA
ncbi:hypothetical protein GALL_327500 [mine drainage metagenome]|uniref:Sulfotransferase domain-containing protein n=1 Tax=mine drainage metagenome TaxID=410659 RepID=A0A1J5QPB8_9ZZZZ